MNCPLCDYKGLADDVQNCPSCNADLSAYRSLDDVERAMQKQKKLTLLFIILFFVALIACAAIYFLVPTGADATTKEVTEQTQAEDQALKAENEKLNAEIITLQSDISRLESELMAAKEKQLTTHTIIWGETLYSLAEDYYGNGEKYLKLAADNCIEDPDFIIAGTELNIFK
jgi:nucleoid-associated protein YgaU